MGFLNEPRGAKKKIPRDKSKERAVKVYQNEPDSRRVVKVDAPKFSTHYGWYQNKTINKPLSKEGQANFEKIFPGSGKLNVMSEEERKGKGIMNCKDPVKMNEDYFDLRVLEKIVIKSEWAKLTKARNEKLNAISEDDCHARGHD